MNVQLEALKDEVYATLGTIHQQKLMMSELDKSMEQYRVVIAMPIIRNCATIDLIGYPVQIRKGVGAFGSERVLFRKANGDLITWENQGFLRLTDEQHETILPLFEEMIIEDEEIHTEGYMICGKNRKVGYIIEDDESTSVVTGQTTTVTVKNGDTIKEQIVIVT
ncbi:MAG: hypothetical protein WCW84_06720 [Sulfurimonas sp.]